MVRISIALFFALSPTFALADMQAARSCAADLQPGAKAIFDGTLASVRSGSKPKEAIMSTRAELIKAGTISQADARTQVQAAVACLKLLKNK